MCKYNEDLGEGRVKSRGAGQGRERVTIDGVNSDVVKGDVVKSEEASETEAEEGDEIDLAGGLGCAAARPINIIFGDPSDPQDLT